jgi:hypothetical protein
VRLLRRIVNYIRGFRTEDDIATGGTHPNAVRARKELERSRRRR